MDERTDNTLDELAGLFLTPTPQPPHAPSPNTSASSSPEGPNTFDQDPISGPAPIKLPPKVAAPPSFGPSSFNTPSLDTPSDPLLDLLAGITPPDDTHVTDPASSASATNPALRWTGHDEIDLTNPPRTAGPVVGIAQAVILGNLPGMAGPWLTQYAQLLAQNEMQTHAAPGAVAILHLDGDELDLELIEPATRRPIDPNTSNQDTDTNQTASPPALRVPPGGFGNRDLIDVLDQLCRTGATPVHTVLLNVDSAAPNLDQLLDIPHWTLISGADDAAIVAGYRLIKRLLDHDDPRVPHAHVGLMIMGSEQDASQHAADKLHQAVDSFLHTPIDLVGFQKQMIPSRCRTLGTFGNLAQVWPRLTAWLSQLQAPAAITTATAQPTVATAAAPTPATPTANATDVHDNHAHDDTANEQAARLASAHRAFPPLKRPVKVSASPTAQPALHENAASTNSFVDADIDADPTIDLFALIDTDPRVTASIPGGLALEARCPSQPQTQLALDAAGGLHLLHRHDSAQGDPPTPREAIVELIAVRTWARQHRQLLQLTERGRHFDPNADPTLHLFTDRADLSVELVSRLGSLLKLHLLRDVTVGDQHTWFSTPLSA
ncbi:MAG: hypothetical protein V3V20_01425 [Algisphaera sp.]